jgi:hypothetical protein
MPKSLEPEIDVFEVWLQSDANKPIETRPVFICKTQSMRGQRKLLTAYDQFYDTTTNETIDQKFATLIDVVFSILAGWRNMGGKDLTRESIDELLTHAEATELVRKVAMNAPSHEEKKS